MHQFFVGLLSKPGRTLVSAILRQRGNLYGPGALPLKDIVTDYPSLTGSHKALLGCIQLIVFREVLVSVQTIVSTVLHQAYYRLNALFKVLEERGRQSSRR